ncbi:MAG: class I SAM-dependent methyltransferase [Pseudomonadota bacterium]
MSEATEDAAQHMDGIYKYQRYIYDLTRKYFLLGRDRLLDDLQPEPDQVVLEVGCGTGRNLIQAARRYPEARFYGFDISNEMLITARSSIERAGLSGRITLAQGDATSFDMKELFGVEAADRIFISYALSMIPPWRDAIPEAVKALAPQGRLHIVDFGQQSGLPTWYKSVHFAWLRKFSVHPSAELEQVLREIADGEGVRLSFQRLYRGYADYAVLTRPA